MLLFAIIIVFLAIAGGFALYLVKRDRGESEPIGALWAAFGLGALGITGAAFFEGFLPDPFIPNQTLTTIAVASLGIGLVEELCKCLPLIFFLYRKRYFNEHTDGVIYFALAGMGFGLPENILYTLQYGTRAGLVRVVLTPLFHAATTGIIGYALARSKISGVSKGMVYVAIVAAIVIHGIYDFGLFSGIPLLAILSVAITVALSINLFLLFKRAKQLDEQRGLSVVGHNSFCRTCGTSNPEHKLYCSHCGNRA